jgi:nicotinamide-nucleotide amidase
MSSPIEQRVGERLSDRGETIAVAESATGGLIGSLLTDVPGASAYFDRSLVTYAYEAKLEELAVARETLDEVGAVSQAVAGQMAAGVRDRSGTDWGLATTGVAGPDGGSAETPVGTVYIGLSRAAAWESGDSWTAVSRYEFDGDRAACKGQFARQALADLETSLTEAAPPAGATRTDSADTDEAAPNDSNR